MFRPSARQPERTLARAAVAVMLGCLLLGSVPTPMPVPPMLALQESGGGKINGMTVSTARGSSEWGRDHMVPTITDLREMGVNWIAIHPYARINRDGDVSFRRGDDDYSTAPDWLRRPIEEAHRQGVKILIKPHLAYWRDYSWRGEIEYSTEEQWDRFFTGYREWITAMARFSEGADAFAVGTELDRTVVREQEWREIIAAVRTEYSGPLTYAANWTDYESIPFWDALDAIGIQAYFPVLERQQVEGGRVPPQEEFDAGWESIMARLRSFGERQGKTIVFTEAGYNLSARAPYEPWDYENGGGENAAILQERCMRAALRAISREPAVVGSFLWKWFPGTRQPRDFAMSTPDMRRVISEFWAPTAGASSQK